MENLIQEWKVTCLFWACRFMFIVYEIRRLGRRTCQVSVYVMCRLEGGTQAITTTTTTTKKHNRSDNP